MSRNSPSALHERAQRDDIHGGPPAKWPRRESERPAVVRHSRGKGGGHRSSSPGAIRIHLDIGRPAKANRRNTGILDAASLGRSDPDDGWYRSARGRRWHFVEDGETACDAEIVRAAGPRSVIDTHRVSACGNCA